MFSPTPATTLTGEEERRAMNYEEFLAAVGNHGGPTEHGHANQACKVVLDALGQRLAGHEPHDLASQLPVELQDTLLIHTGTAETSDELDDFLRRVADREGRSCSPDEALQHARAVLGTMATFVSAGEIEDLRAQLPADYSPLFEQPA